MYSNLDNYYEMIEKLISYDEMFVEYPVINIDSNEIEILNHKIYSKLDNIYNSVEYSPNSSDSGIYLNKFTYSSSQITNYEDYYSLIIKYQKSREADFTPLPSYDVYTINKKTGKFVDNKELLNIFNLSEEEAEKNFIDRSNKINLPECVIKENSELPSNYCYWKDKTLPIISNAKLYIDNNGDLMIIPDCFELTIVSNRSSVDPIKLN